MRDREACLHVLDLSPAATERDIKDAYRVLVKVWHPDRFSHDPKLQNRAQEKMKEINAAYEWLVDHPYAGHAQQQGATSTSDRTTAGTETGGPRPPTPPPVYDENRRKPESATRGPRAGSIPRSLVWLGFAGAVLCGAVVACVVVLILVAQIPTTPKTGLVAPPSTPVVAATSEQMTVHPLETSAAPAPGNPAPDMDAVALWSRGWSYANGHGVPRDEAEAVKWYRKAADAGNAEAMSEIGVCYANGQGVPQDDAEAVKWYRKAAEAGNADGMYDLSVCCEKGQGVQQDQVEAMTWLCKAAEAGSAEAKSVLAAQAAATAKATADE